MSAVILRPEMDGKDHLNIYSRAATAIGRWCSNWEVAPIDLPVHGRFQSIEGYWYWLGSGDDRLRNLAGWNAKKVGRTVMRERVDGFEELITLAIKIKLATYAERAVDLLHEDLIELPIVHYYVMPDRVIDVTAKYQWMLDIFDNYRKGKSE